MTANVKTHTRKLKNGKTTTVKQHSRRTKGRKGLVSPAHALKLAKKAIAAHQKRRRAAAVVFASLAAAEVGAWATLRGVGLVLATAGFVAIGVAALAGMASGWDGRK